MAFNGAYYLIDDNGNTVALKSRPQHLKDAFDRAGLEAAWLAYSPKEKLLRVTKDTPNSVWNEFTNIHRYDMEALSDYLSTYSDYFDSLEKSVDSET